MIKHIVFRILAGFVLLAAIVGIAVFAFNAGMARGAVLNIPNSAEGGPVILYGMPYWRPFFGVGFGFFGVLIPLFLLFMAFGAARRMVWGPRWGWHRMQADRCAEKYQGSEFVPPMFAEWHRRAHGAPENPAEEASKS